MSRLKVSGIEPVERHRHRDFDDANSQNADLSRSKIADERYHPRSATDAVQDVNGDHHGPYDRRTSEEVPSSAHPGIHPVVRGVLLVTGLSMVAWLIWRAGPAVVWTLLIGLRWRFAVVTGLYIMYLATRALALWRIVARPARYTDVLRIRLMGDTIENLTFTGPFVSEPTKGWLLTRAGLPTERAFAAIATEYLLYDVVTGCLSVVAVVTLLALGVLPPVFKPIAFTLIGISAAYLTAFVYAAVSGVGLVAPLINRLAPLIGRRARLAAEKIRPVERVLVHFLQCRHRALAEVLALQSMSQVFMMLELYIVLTAISGSPPWWYLVVIEGAAKYIGLAFAFVPGQVGAAEGVYTFLARVLGLSAAAGLTVALVRRIRGVLVAAIILPALTLFDSRAAGRQRY